MISDLEYFDYSINNELFTSNLSENLTEIPINGIYLKNTFNNMDNLKVTRLNTYNIKSNTDLINQRPLTKKRQRQLKINQSSQKTRKKIKLKINLMENHITNLHKSIQIIFDSLQVINIPNLVSNIFNITNEINTYNKNLIEELKKI